MLGELDRGGLVGRLGKVDYGASSELVVVGMGRLVQVDHLECCLCGVDGLLDDISWLLLDITKKHILPLNLTHRHQLLTLLINLHVLSMDWLLLLYRLLH